MIICIGNKVIDGLCHITFRRPDLADDIHGIDYPVHVEELPGLVNKFEWADGAETYMTLQQLLDLARQLGDQEEIEVEGVERLPVEELIQPASNSN